MNLFEKEKEFRKIIKENEAALKKKLLGGYSSLGKKLRAERSFKKLKGAIKKKKTSKGR